MSAVERDAEHHTEDEDADLAAALEEWGDCSTSYESTREDAANDSHQAPSTSYAITAEAKRQCIAPRESAGDPCGLRPIPIGASAVPSTTAALATHNCPAPAEPSTACLAMADLPFALLLRVFSFLAADDLTTVAKACRLFRLFAAEDNLWRRLYCARWGKPSSSQSMKTWKVQYQEQDAEEVQSALSGVTENMRDVFLEMQRAKRQRALGRSVIDDLMPVHSNVLDKITAWRQARGFGGQQGASARPDLSRRRQQYTFHAISNTHWLCNETGWLHVCDNQCGERVIDPATQMLVCPVSGTLTDRLMSECECREAAAPRGCTDDPGEQDFFGTLARAYEVGYSCSDERELQKYWRDSGFRSF